MAAIASAQAVDQHGYPSRAHDVARLSGAAQEPSLAHVHAAEPAPVRAAAPQGGRRRGGEPVPGNLRDGLGATHNESQGRRLTVAFEAVAAFPVMAESRRRLEALAAEGEPEVTDVAAVVGCDVALTLNVLRLANRVEEGRRARIDDVYEAVEMVAPSAVLALARRNKVYDFFERGAEWQSVPERFRQHAITTQRVAGQIAAMLGPGRHESLATAALLHDVGKLVLIRAYQSYPVRVDGYTRTPDERVQSERRELGIDHALVGGVLARRFSLPATVASVIEQHHNPAATGAPAIVRLADMLAHYLAGAKVAPAAMTSAASNLDISAGQLRELLYELPVSTAASRAHQVVPCPLSSREIEVLRGLAKSMVYKQIASSMGLSTSTVRTHLHNVYGKLGVMDRAQAVLIATERGWL